MKISYAITVCNEFLEIQKLVTFLLDNKRQEDEIIILYDQGNGDKGVEDYLRSKSVNGAFNWHSGIFEGHFANWKNKLTSLCSGDYIFNIDADEIPHINLIENLPTMLETNDIDMLRIPRVNTVEGLTQEHIQKWGWNVNEKGWVNFPDVQTRIYKNKPEQIGWSGKVHERIGGFENYTNFPLEEIYCIKHPKTIERQEKQNNYYDTL